MMTKTVFDDFIKIPRMITQNIYEENKELFDEAERQGKIQIKENSSQITDGKTKHPVHKTYHIEPL